MTGTIKKNRERGHALGTALGILIVLFMLVGCVAAAPPAGTESYHGKQAAANQVLVKFHAATPEQIQNVQAGEDMDKAEAVGRAGAIRFHSRSKNVTALIRDLSARADVEYAEPDYIVYATGTPNDPSFGSLWGLNKISAPSAWDSSTGSTANVAAVVAVAVGGWSLDLTGGLRSRGDVRKPSIGLASG